MRDLKLRYFLELVSNIGAKSEQDARMVESAQRRIKTALGSTTDKVGALERAFVRLDNNSGSERQLNYMRRLGAAVDQNLTKVRQLGRALLDAAPKATAIAGGAAGAFYAGKTLLDKPMDYSLRLAHMSNTAFGERDLAGRVAGKAELDAAITKAVQYGGGTRDAAAGTLDSMIASGALPIEAAKKMLPSLMKASAGSGASPEALAGIAIKAMQTFKITADQIPELLNIAMKAGQAGGFELKDMAKWLPQMMASGKLSGLQGMEGFRRIVAGAQASVITSGSKDEAGNNVVNLLAKINANDTAKDFKKEGYDLTGRLVQARKDGVNSIDAFISFVDEISAKDPEYVALRKQLAEAKSPGEKVDTTEALASLLEGKAVGKVIQDRQALMYLVAEMNNRGYVADVMGKTRTKTDAIGTAHSLVSMESAYKSDALGNSRDTAMSRAFGAGGPLNALLDGANYVAKEFPVLTSAVVATTAALGVFATALAAFGLLAGRGVGLPGAGGPRGGLPKGGNSPGPWPVLDGAAAAAPAVASGLGLGGVLSLASKALGPLMLLEALTGPSDDDIQRLYAYEARQKQGHRGKGYNDPRLLSLTAPVSVDSGASRAASGKLEIGEGRLGIDVRVTDERVTATPSVLQQPSLIRINPGATNPGGLR